jgi:hypothetical protein
MSVKSAQALAGLIVCKDTTGALSTPTVGPVGTLYVNGASNAASVSFTGSNPYKWAVTLPALTAGDSVSVYITATIAAIATASIVFEDTSDTKRVSDLNDAIAAPDATAIQAAAAAALSAINLDHLLKLAKDTNWATTVTKESVIDLMTSKDSNQTFDRASDSAEAARDKLPPNLEDLAVTDTTGLVSANLAQIMGVTLTGTAAQIAAAFVNFFNVADPTGTVNSLPAQSPNQGGGLPTCFNSGQLAQQVLAYVQGYWATDVGVYQLLAGAIPTGASGGNTFDSSWGTSYIDDQFAGSVLYTQSQWAATVLGYNGATGIFTLDRTIPLIAEGAFFILLPSSATITKALTLGDDAVNNVLNGVVEITGPVTVRNALQASLASVAGPTAGGGTATLVFKDPSGGIARITATVDESNNRTVIVLDFTDPSPP